MTAAEQVEAPPGSHRPHRSLGVEQVDLDDPFWSPRQEQVRTTTLQRQHAMLVDTGRLAALRLRWRPGDEPVPHIFWDSDVAKWVEAASYSLAAHPDPALRADVDEAVELLAGAQQPDGYLNTYFTVVAPGRRFTDLTDAHELYCAGHLIEAGVAHARATGSSRLLDVVARYADLIAQVFGTGSGQLPGYDGHEEVELALVKLARATGERRYLDLAAYFVDERGRRPAFFDAEARRRGAPGFFAGHFSWRDSDPQRFREYNQTHAPVREQREVRGHAVRAMYLYSAMADLARELPDEELRAACDDLWEHLTSRQMYVTGGIGADASIEGFGPDFDLPNDSAYAETCASIGLVMWAHRMALLRRDSRYADVLDRALHNGVLAGISADGDRFFYDNRLSSDGSVHRQDWFDVACCPPNLARLVTSLGSYVYSAGGDELAVHLYIGSRVVVDVAGSTVRLRQTTSEGGASFVIQLDAPVTFELQLRLPDWCPSPALRVNGDAVRLDGTVRDGYARLRREWHDGDLVDADLPAPAQLLHADPRVRAAVGRVAVRRGPFVYCAEEVDNGPGLDLLALPADPVVEAVPAQEVPGVPALQAHAVAEEPQQLYRAEPARTVPRAVRLVPYFSWDNRAPGQMLVWLRESC